MSGLDGSKPQKGSQAEAHKLRAFAIALGRLGWFEGLRALGKDSLLLIDPEVQAAIEQLAGHIGADCQPPAFIEKLPKGVERLYVLARAQEWPLVQRLRRRFPDTDVISITYDVMPLGALEGEDLPDAPFDADGLELKAPPRFILCHAGSDVEYLGLMTERSGIGAVRYLVPEALVPWVLLSDHFHVVRFAVRALHVVQQLAVLPRLDMGLLQLLVWHTPLSFKRFVSWANACESHVLYFVSRDAVRQAAINELLRDQLFGSLWDRSEATAAGLEVNLDVDSVEKRLLESFRIDTSLERPIQNLNHFKMVTLEELVLAGGQVFDALCQFWGKQAELPVPVTDWKKRYEGVPGFISSVGTLRREIEGRFGLTGTKDTR